MLQLDKLLEGILIVLLDKLRIAQSVECQGIGTSAAFSCEVQVLGIVAGSLAVVATSVVGFAAPKEGIGIGLLVVAAHLE